MLKLTLIGTENLDTPNAVYMYMDESTGKTLTLQAGDAAFSYFIKTECPKLHSKRVEIAGQFVYNGIKAEGNKEKFNEAIQELIIK